VGSNRQNLRLLFMCVCVYAPLSFACSPLWRLGPQLRAIQPASSWFDIRDTFMDITLCSPSHTREKRERRSISMVGCLLRNGLKVRLEMSNISFEISVKFSEISGQRIIQIRAIECCKIFIPIPIVKPKT
jgi:hypothetical protein